jgi:hypothetical protein
MNAVTITPPDWREYAPRLEELKALLAEFKRDYPDEWPRICQRSLGLDADMQHFLFHPPAPWHQPTRAMRRALLRWNLRRILNIPDPHCERIADALEIAP